MEKPEKKEESLKDCEGLEKAWDGLSEDGKVAMMADMDADEADKLMNAYDACMELAAEEEEKKRVEKEVREKLEVICPAAEKKMAGMSDEQLVAEMDKMTDDEL